MLKQRIARLGLSTLVTAALLSFSTAGVAATFNTAATTTSTSKTTPSYVDDAWHFGVAPYVWALNMNGRTQVGSRTAHVDQDFSDILNHLNWAGMLWLDANKGKFGLFLNSLFAVLTDGSSQGPFSVYAKNRFGLFSAGASYEMYRHDFCPNSWFAITPYAGARYTVNHTNITFSAFQYQDSQRLDEEWLDPIVGARLNYQIAKAWDLIFAADIGGTNASRDYSYNVNALIGYSPQTMLTNSTIYLGYRLLDQRYSTGSGRNYYNWDMKIFGPLLGIKFTF